jgi:hypothetical protein
MEFDEFFSERFEDACSLPESCDALQEHYQPHLNEAVKHTQYAARAAITGSPFFLSSDGRNVADRVYGYYNSFTILPTPDGDKRLYMKLKLGIQVFWINC